MSGLIPWSGMGDLDRLRGEMDRLFDRVSDWKPFDRISGKGVWVPSIDITETEGEILIKAEVPGIETKDLDITLKGKTLTLKGQKEGTVEEKGKTYHRVERFQGSFSRSIELPAEVSDEDVKASYDKGVLTIVLPKVKEEMAKRITVKSA